MNFDIYEAELEEAFQDNPVIALEELLINNPNVSVIDFIKISVLLQEQWLNYQKYGLKLIVYIDEEITIEEGTSIKEYDFASDINGILKIRNCKCTEYIMSINGFILERKFSKTDWNIDMLSRTAHSNKKIAFLLGLNGLDTVINGVLYESKNHLSSYKDIIWAKLISIDSYSELLSRFFNEHVQYDIKKRYFLYKDSIHPDWSKQLLNHPKLLINKPEEKFQLDLVRFLKDNCLDTVLKEVQNDEAERYDIWVITDQKEVYIFELKWLGKSITPVGGINSNYDTEERAIEGAYQLDDYIKNEETTLEGLAQSRIHLGILVLFDAREEMGDIHYPDEVKKIPNLDLTQHFKIEKTKVKASQAYKSIKKRRQFQKKS